MVYDKETLATMPQFSFSHVELQQIFEAAKSDDDIKPRTLDKLKILWSIARTADAYGMGPTTITIRSGKVSK